MSEFKQSELIRAALEGVKNIVDSNTVLGKPIVTSNNTTIIPVSKISMGLATGGLDYFGKNHPPVNASANDLSKMSSFGGGGGTGINVTPLGFLVVKEDGTVELLTVDSAGSKPAPAAVIDSVMDVIEHSPEIADKIQEVIGKFKKKKDDDGKTPDDSQDKEKSDEQKGAEE